MYKYFIRNILFLLPPETAHKITFFILKIFQKLPIFKFIYTHNHKYDKEVDVVGIKFPNRLGVAAGLDKDAEVFDALGTLGFGFVEIGTVTPKPQSGNPKPRLFRLKKDKALINRMGFNNQGVVKAKKRLKKRKTNVIIGGNIGKNKFTPNENAIDDYIFAFKKLYPVVDYFVINVSSPNTPGLRNLQDKKPLMKILSSLQDVNKNEKKEKPIFLKIAPDLNFSQIDEIIEVVKKTKIAGIVATNTTVSRNGLSEEKNKIDKIGNGGLSGKPLKDKSTEIIKYIKRKSNGEFAIIGVGGIFSQKDALEKLNAGADLIQIFTSFIYEGPSLVKKINKAIYDYPRN